MPVTIRHAGPGDEAAIVLLVREMAEEDDDVSPIDEHYVRHFLASPVSGALLAHDGDEPVGLLSYAVTPGLFHAADSGLIELLVVTGTPARRGHRSPARRDGAARLPGRRLRRGVGEHRRGQRDRAEALLRRGPDGGVRPARDAL